MTDLDREYSEAAAQAAADRAARRAQAAADRTVRQLAPIADEMIKQEAEALAANLGGRVRRRKKVRP